MSGTKLNMAALMRCMQHAVAPRLRSSIRALHACAATPTRTLTRTRALTRARTHRLTLASAGVAHLSTTAPQDETILYWRDLWKQSGDVFTLPEVNENLKTHVTELLPTHTRTDKDTCEPEDIRVFVPLCGRSHDLTWLAGDRSHTVVALDAIAEPLRVWSQENGGLDPVSSTAHMSAYRSRWYPNLHMLHGDVFALQPGDLPFEFDGVWDRGGVTSIPAENRLRYMRLMHDLLRARGRIMIEFLACNLPLDGSMDPTACTDLLKAAGFEDIRVLKDTDVADEYPAFRPEGFSYLRELLVIASKPDTTTTGTVSA